MADKSGAAVLTGRTIDIETTQIANPQKITGKADDVLGLIGQLSSKLGSDMSLAPKGSRPGGAGKSGPAQSGGPTSSSTTAQAETYAKVLPAAVVEKTMKTKLDAATMKLYSKALDEIDAHNKDKAIDLLKQVKSKSPDFEPAQRNRSHADLQPQRRSRQRQQDAVEGLERSRAVHQCRFDAEPHPLTAPAVRAVIRCLRASTNTSATGSV